MGLESLQLDEAHRERRRALVRRIDSSGGIRTGAFAEHIAKVTGQDAQTLKQHRLLREERAARTKEKDKKGKGKGEPADA